MYYKHSGRFSIGGLGLGFLIGCTSALILGYLYGRGTILIDDERFAFLVTIVFGAALGGATGYGLVLGNVRNQTANLFVQAVVSVFGLYLSWAAWVADILRRFNIDDMGWIELARNPARLWQAMIYVNQSGTWSLGKGEPATKGTMLLMIWIAEAAIVIGAAMVVGYEMMRRHAFCERCESWCKRGANLILTSPANPATLKRQLETKDWRSLEVLSAGDKTQTHLKVELDSCEQCHQLNTMSLTHTTIWVNKLRQKKTARTKFMRHLLIDAAQAETLKQLSTRTQQAQKVTPLNTQAAATGKR